MGGWRFDNTYSRLPGCFYSLSNPTPVRQSQLVVFNEALAESMGLNSSVLKGADDFFTGNAIPFGSEPIAQAYAGHQFGHFTMLGDGRAILMGEHLSPDGSRHDVHLKGTGCTAYSRRGDGRAALGPMLREYIISEAMHALGIPTTRSLAVASTGEAVIREETLPGAVLTRVAESHIRVGTFEYAAMLDRREMLEALTDYTIRRHFPALLEFENPALGLLQVVIERQAALVARWMSVGFIHGVMNTDNMALSGETIDYGPCAFMDQFDPATVFSSIDRGGRYAYGNQPGIAHWNLARFAETLLPLLATDESNAIDLAKEALSHFCNIFQNQWLAGMRAKLGLFNQEPEDISLVETLLESMRLSQSDFTGTFRKLDPETDFSVNSNWHEKWISRLGRQSQSFVEVRSLMRSKNPAVIPRNHKVEEALQAATQSGNLQPFHRLMEALKCPFEEGGGNQDFLDPSADGSAGYRTFCGT